MPEPRNYELDYRYTLANLRYLLECTLAMYARECCKSKPRKRELERLASILEKTLVPVAKDLLELSGTRTGYRASSTWMTCPRVDEIVEGATQEAQGVMGSLHRWLMKERGLIKATPTG